MTDMKKVYVNFMLLPYSSNAGAQLRFFGFGLA